MPSSSASNSASNSGSNSNSVPVPVLYIEESVPRVRNPGLSKYDTDWRMYIAYRYGKYVLCGTRQPVESAAVSATSTSSISKSRLRRKEKKNKSKDYARDARDAMNTDDTTVEEVVRKWPVIALSFDDAYDIYTYALSLFGTSKVNVTLYVSATCGVEMDELFARPSHDNFHTFDADRSNRLMELVGYDRVTMPIQYYGPQCKNSNIVQQLLTNLVLMTHSPSGMGLSFTCAIPTPTPTVESNNPQPTPDIDTQDIQYDDYFEYVHSGGSGAYVKAYDYPQSV